MTVTGDTDTAREGGSTKRESVRTVVAYLGPRGTFTEEAVRKTAKLEGAPFVDGAATMYVPCDTIEETLEFCAEGNADIAVVPIENSLGGAVVSATDYLGTQDGGPGLDVVGETVLEIRQCLWGLPGATREDVELVYSHPQALLQCREYLKSLPKLRGRVATVSTSAAATVIRSKHESSLGGPLIGEVYGLDAIAENVQDVAHNRTRFLILRKRTNAVTDALPECFGEKTALACALDGERPGALAEGLMFFANRGINLVRIESRPRHGRLGEYTFFFDLDTSAAASGGRAEEDVRAALEDLRRTASYFRVLGTYDVWN